METKVIIATPIELKTIVVEAVASALQYHPTLHQQNNLPLELITAEQLRTRLNICRASERSYVRAGVLKPQHLGRRVYYRWDEVTASLSTKQAEFLPSKLRSSQTKKTAN